MKRAWRCGLELELGGRWHIVMSTRDALDALTEQRLGEIGKDSETALTVADHGAPCEQAPPCSAAGFRFAVSQRLEIVANSFARTMDTDLAVDPVSKSTSL
jgi:hypothetical protein